MQKKKEQNLKQNDSKNSIRGLISIISVVFELVLNISATRCPAGSGEGKVSSIVWMVDHQREASPQMFLLLCSEVVGRIEPRTQTHRQRDSVCVHLRSSTCLLVLVVRGL